MNRLQTSRRMNNIGYSYAPMVINDISNIQYGRNTSQVEQDMFRNQAVSAPIKPSMNDMKGDGIKDTLQRLYDKGKALVSKGSDLYSSDLGTALKNMVPSSDENARPSFPGEKHALLKLPNGKMAVGSFMGPGTQIIKRLKRGDVPRTLSDKVAQAHDIRYGLAKDLSDIRTADKRMISKLNDIERKKGDHPLNIQMGKRLIQAKVIGEDLGLLKKDAFSGDLSKNTLSAEDRALMTGKLKQLEQEGYGVKGHPAMKLKMSILRSMKGKNKNKKGKGHKLVGVSKGKSFPSTKAYPLKGSGLKLSGAGLESFITKSILPSLFKMLKIPPSISPELVESVVRKSIQAGKAGDISSLVGNVSKVLVPLLSALKHKSMGGSGMVKLPTKKKKKLVLSLSKGIVRALLAGHKGGSLHIAGGGLKIAGGDAKQWFSDFWKGFKSVFKPGAKILGPIANAMGVPEIGVPLSAIGNAM